METSISKLDDQETSNNNSIGNGFIGRKRRRILESRLWSETAPKVAEEHNEISLTPIPTNEKNKFLHLDCCSGVYQTDNLKQSKDGETLYLPINGDLFLNMEKADEITFIEGIFFIGDETGRYSNSTEGTAMNIWRYSDTRQQMIVARSLLITQPAVFNRIRFYLMGL